MENSFCLIYEKWIPIAGQGLVSLNDIFRSDELKEIEGNAIQKIALLKFLIALAQASIVLKDDDEWRQAGSAGLSESVLQYLQDRRDCFYLYGENPFLQCHFLSDKLKATDVKKLHYSYIPALASDNDSIIRECQFTQNISDSDRAIFLLTLMNYSLGGKSASAIPGITPDYYKKSALSGPSIGGLDGYLNTIVLGSSIRETIWLNYFTAKDIASLNLRNNVRPPWESMPLDVDGARAMELKESIYSCLVAVSRFVLFLETGLFYSEGLRYPSVKDGLIEPFLTINKEKGNAIVCDVSKKPWRAIPSILEIAFLKSGNNQCLLIKLHYHRTINSVGSFAIWAGGLKTRSNSGEQGVKQSDDYVESSVEIESKAADEKFFNQLVEFLKFLDNMAEILFKAVSGYWKSLNVDRDRDIAKKTVSLYWGEMNSLEQRIFAVLQQDDGEEFKNEIKCIVSRLYATTCRFDTSRQLESWVKNKPFQRKKI